MRKVSCPHLLSKLLATPAPPAPNMGLCGVLRDMLEKHQCHLACQEPTVELKMCLKLSLKKVNVMGDRGGGLDSKEHNQIQGKTLPWLLV